MPKYTFEKTNLGFDAKEYFDPNTHVYNVLEDCIFIGKLKIGFSSIEIRLSNGEMATRKKWKKIAADFILSGIGNKSRDILLSKNRSDIAETQTLDSEKEAISFLEEIMKNKGEKTKNRINAACEILAHARATKHEVSM